MRNAIELMVDACSSEPIYNSEVNKYVSLCLIQPAILIDERLKYETNLIAPSVCDIFKSNLVCSEQPAKELDKNKSKGTENNKIVPACEQIEKDVDL
jgi:hypothetical protein